MSAGGTGGVEGWAANRQGRGGWRQLWSKEPWPPPVSHFSGLAASFLHLLPCHKIQDDKGPEKLCPWANSQ